MIPALMKLSLSEYIPMMVPYWHSSREQGSLESYMSCAISESVGKFIDPNENVYFYGHDVSEDVKKSHNLLEYYSQNDIDGVRTELQGILRNAFIMQDSYYRNSEPVWIYLKDYKSKARNSPKEGGRMTRNEAMGAVYNLAVKTIDHYRTLKPVLGSFQTEYYAGDSKAEVLLKMNGALKSHFPERRSFSEFLTGVITCAEIMPYIAVRVTDEKDETLEGRLLPYFILVGTDALKSAAMHSVNCMQSGLRASVYAD
jgi:hypothetical protein